MLSDWILSITIWIVGIIIIILIVIIIAFQFLINPRAFIRSCRDSDKKYSGW